ncbi:hypothetical protein FOB65_00070 (plasmid) [Pseudomonas oryzihabitans]|nr:hypothetical protein FOB65_00070 [Pseudomonas oryzihabitans]
MHLIQGTDRITSYSFSELVLRQHCGQCGSPLFWSRSRGRYADWISIAFGTMDTSFTSEKQRE